MRRSPTREVRHTTRNQTHDSCRAARKKSSMETAAAAAEPNELDWMSKVIIDMEQNLQSEKNDIDIIAAKSDEVLESIDKTYD